MWQVMRMRRLIGITVYPKKNMLKYCQNKEGGGT